MASRDTDSFDFSGIGDREPEVEAWELEQARIISWGNSGAGGDDGAATIDDGIVNTFDLQPWQQDFGTSSSSASRDDDEPPIGGVVIYSDLNYNDIF